MEGLPQRSSLAAQTAQVLRKSIADGEWQQWLPGEIELARRLGIGRVTVRAALAELEREKLITAGQGRRRQIILNPEARRRAAAGAAASRAVGLLVPEPLHRLSGSTVFWIEELREHLERNGKSLELHVSAAAYRQQPEHALEQLVARSPSAGWVLHRSTPQMQAWFDQQAAPAVIAGSQHPGVTLPSIDVNYTAACRHAAGQFSTKGHRHLAILRPETTLAGDLQSVAAFSHGCQDVRCVQHDASVPGICAAMEELFFTRTPAQAQQSAQAQHPPQQQPQRPRPTGLFVFHARYLLTVLGWLQRKGLRVPRDVSVVCRDHQPFLEFVLPAPTRYVLDKKIFARRLVRLVAAHIGGAPLYQPHQILLPTFVAGQTLGQAG